MAKKKLENVSYAMPYCECYQDRLSKILIYALILHYIGRLPFSMDVIIMMKNVHHDTSVRQAAIYFIRSYSICMYPYKIRNITQENQLTSLMERIDYVWLS